MKAILVHDASGRIKSVAFVADNVGYEPEPGEEVLEIDPADIGLSMHRGEVDHERLREHAKKMVEDFRVTQGKVVGR